MQDWQSIETAPEHVVVRTRVRGRDRIRLERRLKRIGVLWFTDDVRPEMVHHTPTEWRPG